MKEKGLWPHTGCLVLAILILSACSPSSTPPALTDRTISSVPSPADTPKATATQSQSPRYGGTLNLISLLDLTIFDPVATGQFMSTPGWLTNEQYLGEDWTRGTAGTGEIDWSPNTGVAPGNCTGILAESWKMPAPGTIVFTVRRGVRWALNPNSEASRLMNGREMTADDWVANFNYFMRHPRSMIKAMPQLASTATMEKTGPWEVTLKTPVDPLTGWGWFAWGTAWYFLLPPEVLNRYGDMKEWRNVVGTGPFMLTDYVASSSVTLAKNQDFWERDPLGAGKGNRLPYLDGIRILIIPEMSTWLAALRSGKTDTARGVTSEDARSLLRSVPTLNQRTFLPLYSTIVAMRIDRADLPYRDRRVRQALMMATDFESLRKDFYGGDAEVMAFPVTRESKTVYVPLKDMPEPVQALYRYDPARAKQVLAEAGYPNGFKARMIVYNGLGSVDLASVYKDMWAKAGIDLELQPRELAVFNSIGYSRAFDEMILAHVPGGTQYPGCLSLGYLRGPSSFFYVDDAAMEATAQQIQKKVIVDMQEADRLYRGILPYIVEQAYYVATPSPTVYALWWPWLKNFYGEAPGRFAAYSWIDQDLKQDITGRR